MHNLNFTDLPWLPLELIDSFPRKPCIYFAVDNSKTVQYVGRSVDAHKRWKDHHKYNELSKLKRIKIYFLVLEAESFLPTVESFFIRSLNPPLNVVGKERGGCIPQQQTSDRERISRKLADKLKSAKGWITYRELVNRSFSIVRDRKVARGMLENSVRLGKLERKVVNNANGTISELYKLKST